MLTVPTHIEVTATRLLDLRSSASAVTTCRAPVAPRGWPKALFIVIQGFIGHLEGCIGLTLLHHGDSLCLVEDSIFVRSILPIVKVSIYLF